MAKNFMILGHPQRAAKRQGQSTGPGAAEALPDLERAMGMARAAVRRILVRYPAQVDDMLQEAALKAHLNRKNFRGDSSYSSWFVRIAINQALMYLRKMRATYTEGSERPLDDYSGRLVSQRLSPEDIVLKVQRRQRLESLLKQLGPTARAAMLRYSQASRGELINTSTEKGRRHHAIVRLRKLAEKEGLL